MKKKLIAAVFAAMLVVALPTSAFAAGSPTTSSATGTNISATYTGTKDINTLQLANTGTNTWTVTWSDGVTSDFGTLVLSFYVGTDHAGQTATINITHADGTTETATSVVSSDGYVSLSVTKLSTFAISFSSSTTAATTTSTKSPTTGVDMTTIAFATLGTVIVAGGVAYALRKQSQR